MTINRKTKYLGYKQAKPDKPQNIANEAAEFENELSPTSDVASPEISLPLPGEKLTPAKINALQGSLGNRAVMRLIDQHKKHRPTPQQPTTIQRVLMLGENYILPNAFDDLISYTKNAFAKAEIKWTPELETEITKWHASRDILYKFDDENDLFNNLLLTQMP